ncbi:hypothetical protein J2Y60_002578 [Arcicella sp. BE140]|nr:hypothetical protein [Arcicella sp. BE51]MDR6812379.1 hypothetical protein [Arcicella sp. BE140]MDR6823849.1 hypothetical protein [Arcicella sp. BE139]
MDNIENFIKNFKSIIANQATEKLLYIGFITVLMSYFTYCKYNGHSLLYLMESHSEKWAPKGNNNGFNHK